MQVRQRPSWTNHSRAQSAILYFDADDDTFPFYARMAALKPSGPPTLGTSTVSDRTKMPFGLHQAKTSH